MSPRPAGEVSLKVVLGQSMGVPAAVLASGHYFFLDLSSQ